MGILSKIFAAGIAAIALVDLSAAAPVGNTTTRMNTRQQLAMSDVEIRAKMFSIADSVAAKVGAMHNYHDARAYWTENTVSALAAEFPELNALIYIDEKSTLTLYTPEHYYGDYTLESSRGLAWGTYQIHLLDEALFVLHGDGGYQNWAFAGVAERYGMSVKFESRGEDYDDDDDEDVGLETLG